MGIFIHVNTTIPGNLDTYFSLPTWHLARLR